MRLKIRAAAAICWRPHRIHAQCASSINVSKRCLRWLSLPSASVRRVAPLRGHSLVGRSLYLQNLLKGTHAWRFMAHVLLLWPSDRRKPRGNGDATLARVAGLDMRESTGNENLLRTTILADALRARRTLKMPAPDAPASTQRGHTVSIISPSLFGGHTPRATRASASEEEASSYF